MKYTDDQIRRALGPHKEQISESEVSKYDDPFKLRVQNLEDKVQALEERLNQLSKFVRGKVASSSHNHWQDI